MRERVREGGHDVPDSIIEHRYRIGISYLKAKILLFNEAYLIDNSLSIPVQIAKLEEGKIVQRISNPPTWAKEVFFIAEKLQNKA